MGTRAVAKPEVATTRRVAPVVFRVPGASPWVDLVLTVAGAGPSQAPTTVAGLAAVRFCCSGPVAYPS